MRFISSRVQLVALFALIAVAGCVTMAANAQTVYNNGSGTSNGYYYALYTSSGSATLTLGSTAGNYALSWSNAGDVVGGVGWNPGSARIVGYNVGSATGYNVISLYGWSENPLVEYYVTELGQLYTATATYKGSVSSDGHTYSTYEHQQVNQPSIVGTATFEQYLDQWGGQPIGTSGTITLANHFNHWSSLGMNLGSLQMQYLATESWSGGSGYANATVWTASSSEDFAAPHSRPRSRPLSKRDASRPRASEAKLDTDL